MIGLREEQINEYSKNIMAEAIESFYDKHYGKRKVIAKKYFNTFGFSYYRTESGHTFMKSNSNVLDSVFYCGNVKQNENIKLLLNAEQKKELFNRVEFVN